VFSSFFFRRLKYFEQIPYGYTVYCKKGSPVASVVDPDPYPHGSASFLVTWFRIRIRIHIKIKITVISWIRNRIRIRINLQMTSQNVWNMSLFEHFLQGFDPYLEARIWIRIRIRIRVKSWIRIRIK
jgi:hypothetical protein